MSDKEIIEQAYAAAIKKLYSTLLDAFALASSQDEKNAALDSFRKGLALAREAKEAAKAAV